MKEKPAFPVHEVFYTFQGEGVHMGRPAFFIRLFGCPVKCPWCDSAGTWHPDWVPADIKRQTPDELRQLVQAHSPSIVVLTGGEPAVHNLDPLVNALSRDDRMVHLETSGGFPIRGLMDWITLSPKRWKPPLAANVMLADEFKIIVEKPEDIDFYYTMLIELGLPPEADNPIWLHPEWSKSSDATVLRAISDAVKKNTAPFRAGWQLHKNYRVDLQDPRSRPAVPLGGNPELGY